MKRHSFWSNVNGPRFGQEESVDSHMPGDVALLRGTLLLFTSLKIDVKPARSRPGPNYTSNSANLDGFQ